MWGKVLAGAIAAVIVAGLGYPFIYLTFFAPNEATAAIGPTGNPLDPTRTFNYLKQLCDLGPRPTASAAMKKQQELLSQHFTALGGRVELQPIKVRDMQTGRIVDGANLIVRWDPEKKERVLLCAHYDTRPFPSRDPKNPRGVFIGANDGGSGTAVLMELGHYMAQVKGKAGVDFVFFDAEEFLLEDNQKYFQGAEHFAATYAGRDADAPVYRCGVLLDMVGDKDLNIKQERNSIRWKEGAPLVKDIWATARRLGVREFVNQKGYELQDDHLPLHRIGKIPCCDVIDFDYPAWHTTQDLPENCSGQSMAKVGWVMLEWLKGAVR